MGIDKIMVFRYEIMINNLYGEVLKIVYYLGVLVSNDLVKSILYKLDINE